MNKDKIIIPAQNKADAKQMAECRLSHHFMQKPPVQWSGSWCDVVEVNETEY